MLITYIIIFACIILVTEYSAQQLESLEDNTIKDIGFELFPYYNNKFGDYIGMVLGILYLFLGKNHTEFIKLYSILLVLRIIFMNLTVLPVTHADCKKQQFLPFSGKCRDLVFSGHICFSTLIVIFLINQGTITPLLGTIIIAIHAMFILMARHHYTLDIVIGILASLYIFDIRDKIT